MIVGAENEDNMTQLQFVLNLTLIMCVILNYCSDSITLLTFDDINKTGSVHMNVTLRQVHITNVAVGK